MTSAVNQPPEFSEPRTTNAVRRAVNDSRLARRPARPQSREQGAGSREQGRKPPHLNARPPAKALTREPSRRLERRRELPTTAHPRLELKLTAGRAPAPAGGRAR